jgi:VWFA-related protein
MIGLGLGPVLVLAAAAAAAAQPPPPTFSASVESVYIDVFVRDKDGPVSGLVAADFQLLDNAVPQAVELVAVQSLPLTTLLVLDTSDSVAGQKLAQLQEAGHALLRRARPGDETALIAFGHEIRVRVSPTSNVALIDRALDSLRPAGSTAVYDALYAARMLAPERSRSTIVLFTDGEDNMSVLDIADVLRVLERSDVMVHAVGLAQQGSNRPGSSGLGPLRPAGGADADSPISRQVSQGGGFFGGGRPPSGGSKPESEHVRTLRRLAESTGGRFWTAAAPEALASSFEAIADAMRTRYVLRFEPQGVKREGRHVLGVTLKRRTGTVHCRRTYFVRPDAP